MPEIRPLAEIIDDRLEGVTIEDSVPALLKVAPSALVELARLLAGDRELGFSLLYSITGMDTGEGLGTVYHVYSPARSELAVVKVLFGYDDPRVPSVSGVWPAADWHERECWDMLAITFDGHPDLSHLLVLDHTKGALLRKDVPLRTIEEARARGD